LEKDVFGFDNGDIKLLPEESGSIRFRDKEIRMLRSSEFAKRNPKLYLKNKDLMLTFSGNCESKYTLYQKMNLSDESKYEEGFLEIKDQNLRFVDSNRFLCLDEKKSEIERIEVNEPAADKNAGISKRDNLSEIRDILRFEVKKLDSGTDSYLLVFQKRSEPGLFVGTLDSNSLKSDPVLDISEIDTNAYSVEMDKSNIYIAYMDKGETGKSIKMISISRSSIMK
jgi:hypothetical protein